MYKKISLRRYKNKKNDMEADTDKCAEFSLDEPETEGHILNEEDGEDTSDSERQELEEQQIPKDGVLRNRE